MKHLNTVIITLLGLSIGEANCSHDPQNDPSLNPVRWRNHVNQRSEPDVQPMDLGDEEEYNDAAEMARVMEMLKKSYLEAKQNK